MELILHSVLQTTRNHIFRHRRNVRRPAPAASGSAVKPLLLSAPLFGLSQSRVAFILPLQYYSPNVLKIEPPKQASVINKVCFECISRR